MSVAFSCHVRNGSGVCQAALEHDPAWSDNERAGFNLFEAQAALNPGSRLKAADTLPLNKWPWNGESVCMCISTLLAS